jgi:hypothetical protein
MRLPVRIRYQMQGAPELAEAFRDVQRAFDAIPMVILRKLETQYTVPLVLGNMQNEPDAIEMIRIIDLNAPETPVLCGGLCHYVWRPDRGGAQIMAIDGLTLAANGGKPYRFTLRLTYAAVGDA